MEKLNQDQKNLLADAIARLHNQIDAAKANKKASAVAYQNLIKDKNKLLNKCVISMLSNSIEDEEVASLLVERTLCEERRENLVNIIK